MDARLIIDEPAPGSWNMAVDEALLQSAGQGGGASLRFYQWVKPTLSLVYFQQMAARDEHRPSVNLPVVRRTTGGGAIVHDRELTYSFVTPIRNRFSAKTQDFVKQFHESLIATFATLGIEAQLCGEAPVKTTSEPFLCFQRRDSLDILVGQDKVVGSAQRRHHGTMLQHGSILLAASPHAESLPGLAELCKTTVDPRELAHIWSQRLGKQYGFEWTKSSITVAESSLAKRIDRTRFAHHQWTRKR